MVKDHGDTVTSIVLKSRAHQQGYSASWNNLNSIDSHIDYVKKSWLWTTSALHWLSEKGCNWDSQICYAAAQDNNIFSLQWARENRFKDVTVTGIVGLVILLLKMVISQSSDGREKLAVTGIVGLVMLLLLTAISQSSNV